MCKTFGACFITMMTQFETTASRCWKFLLINNFAGMGGDRMEVLRGWVGMEEKLDGDGRGWKSHLRGLVGMDVISVPVQVSNPKAVGAHGGEMVMEDPT